MERRSKREPKPSRKTHLGFPRDPRLCLLPPRHLPLSILSSFLSQHYPYLPSFDSSDRGDFIYITFSSIFNDISILQRGYQFSVSILGHLPGLRSEQSIRTTGTMSTTSFVYIFSMKHQPFNYILFGFKCSSVICSSHYNHLPT